MQVCDKVLPKARVKGDHATAIEVGCRCEARDRNATVPRARLTPTPLDSRDIKARADFFTIALRYTRLRRTGRQYVGICPFHSERHPSFYVHPEKKIFYCFGCGAGGDVFDFVMRAEGCDFRRALEIISRFGVARACEPRSGERFGARVGARPLKPAKRAVSHSPDSRASILARMDETERVLAAIRRTNDANSRSLATACEPVREARPLPSHEPDN